MARLDPEREKKLRAGIASGNENKWWYSCVPDDVDDLLGEIDYLRKQVEIETVYASEIRRQLNVRFRKTMDEWDKRIEALEGRDA